MKTTTGNEEATRAPDDVRQKLRARYAIGETAWICTVYRPARRKPLLRLVGDNAEQES